MTSIRIYLALVGLLYTGLAVYCAARPNTAAQKVALSPVGDHGRSEFFTVYGGLEFGLAIALLLPFVAPGMTLYALYTCIAVHAALVVFRGISLAIYRPGFDLSSLFARLVIGEWVVLLSALAVWWIFHDRA